MFINVFIIQCFGGSGEKPNAGNDQEASKMPNKIHAAEESPDVTYKSCSGSVTTQETMILRLRSGQ